MILKGTKILVVKLKISFMSIRMPILGTYIYIASNLLGKMQEKNEKYIFIKVIQYFENFFIYDQIFFKNG